MLVIIINMVVSIFDNFRCLLIINLLWLRGLGMSINIVCLLIFLLIKFVLIKIVTIVFNREVVVKLRLRKILLFVLMEIFGRICRVKAIKMVKNLII